MVFLGQVSGFMGKVTWIEGQEKSWGESSSLWSWCLKHSSLDQLFFLVGNKCPKDSHLFHTDTFFLSGTVDMLIFPMKSRHNEGQPPLIKNTPTLSLSTWFSPDPLQFIQLDSAFSSFMLGKRTISGYGETEKMGALLSEDVCVETPRRNNSH